MIMEKILNLGSYKRRRIMRPSYITDRLESLAHDMSVCTWIFYSPRSTEEERGKANRLLRRFVHRVTRYHYIRNHGGMEKYFAHYDEQRFNDFVAKAERMMEEE